jgi:MYXO-CTERM domain-containing protein
MRCASQTCAIAAEADPPAWIAGVLGLLLLVLVLIVPLLGAT